MRSIQQNLQCENTYIHAFSRYRKQYFIYILNDLAENDLHKNKKK